MGMDRDFPQGLREGNEGDFGGFCWIQADQRCSTSELERKLGSNEYEMDEEKVGITYWVITAESKAKAVCLIQVEWVCV